jgi:hypothetical protein
VSFIVQAVALADLAATFRRGLRTVTMIAAVGSLGTVVVTNAAFTLSFHRFLDRTGGTAGDYGVVYRHKAELAAFVRAHGSRVADEDVLDFLVTGDIEVPRGNAPLVTVTDRIHNVRPPCPGECDPSDRSTPAYRRSDSRHEHVLQIGLAYVRWSTSRLVPETLRQVALNPAHRRLLEPGICARLRASRAAARPRAAGSGARGQRPRPSIELAARSLVGSRTYDDAHGDVGI